MMTIALTAVILECFVFAIALQLAALVIEFGPSQPARRRRCIRCGRWFDTDPAAPGSAFCGFCAVVAVYERAEIVRAYN